MVGAKTTTDMYCQHASEVNSVPLEACCSKKWDSSSGDFEILHVFSDQKSTLAI